MSEPVNTKRPRMIRSFWEWWKRLGKRIGDFQARILLTLFYFLILPPFALAVRLGSDPLALKTHAPKWYPRNAEEGASMERATRQF